MGGANNAVGVMAAYLNQSTAAVNVSNVQPNRKALEAPAAGFDKILNQVSDTMIQSRTTDAVKDAAQQVTNARAQDNVQNVKTDVSDKSSPVKETVNSNEAGTSNTEAVGQDVQAAEAKTPVGDETQVTDAELTKAIEEMGNELISQIADTFKLSEEDVVNAMQVLGLMATDLFNPAALTQLVTQLSGQEDTADLITDSDIYTSLQDLMEGAESMKMGLMNEFNLSEEEVQTALDQAGESFKNSLDKAVISESPEVVVPLETIKEAEPVMEKPQKAETKAPVSEAFTDTADFEEKPPEVTVSTSKEGQTKGNLDQGAGSSNLFNQVMNNIADAAEQVADQSQVSYTDRAQMEDIIRQITDKITISAKAEETSMELALHPASLGNVNVLLTSGKDGIVAKFTAQNQIVKEAVESQMIQLQQKFDEQGIKVTSIEVTIASHGFEQNLDQQGDRGARQSGEGQKARGLRRINLSELADDEEPESEAEKIAVQMMAANGNSVDFSA